MVFWWFLTYLTCFRFPLSLFRTFLSFLIISSPFFFRSIYQSFIEYFSAKHNKMKYLMAFSSTFLTTTKRKSYILTELILIHINSQIICRYTIQTCESDLFIRICIYKCVGTTLTLELNTYLYLIRFDIHIYNLYKSFWN